MSSKSDTPDAPGLGAAANPNPVTATNKVRAVVALLGLAALVAAVLALASNIGPPSRAVGVQVNGVLVPGAGDGCIDLKVDDSYEQVGQYLIVLTRPCGSGGDWVAVTDHRMYFSSGS